MKKFFKYIRSKSPQVRETYAFSLALGFTLVVCFIWLGTGAGLNENESPETEKQMPFATFFKESKEQLGTVLSSFNKDIKAIATTSREVSETKPELGIKLSDEDIELAKEKERSTENTFPEKDFLEVLIGTTSVSGTTSADFSTGVPGN